MTCIPVKNGIICINPWGRLHVGNRYIWVDFHEYCGPNFYTTKNGYEIEYQPEDENDPVWPEFENWLEKYQKKKKSMTMTEHEHGRGEIKDDAMAALVTSNLFRPKQETPEKGKGSYKRKPKHRNEDKDE